MVKNEWFEKNVKRRRISVFHARLTRLSDESHAKSHCPFCPDGVLVMVRDRDHKLLAEDRCRGCGQHVYYEDIEEARKIVL